MLRAHTDSVVSIAVSGTTALSASHDRTVRVWDVKVRPLTQCDRFTTASRCFPTLMLTPVSVAVGRKTAGFVWPLRFHVPLGRCDAAQQRGGG